MMKKATTTVYIMLATAEFLLQEMHILIGLILITKKI